MTFGRTSKVGTVTSTLTIDSLERVGPDLDDKITEQLLSLEIRGYTGRIQALSHSITPLPDSKFLLSLFIMREP